MIALSQICTYEREQRFGPRRPWDDDPETFCFWDDACDGIIKQEQEWKESGEVFAWIDQVPVWVSAADWDLDILPSPEKPGKRSFRLSLLGGGQIRVTEVSKWFTYNPPDSPPILAGRTTLRVQADTATGLYTCNGVIHHGACYEMATYAVVFPKRTRQDIADRTAATLRLIGDPVQGGFPNEENFHALLARGRRCGCCHRPLNDEVSKLLGVGPDCGRLMKVPHTIEAANRILVRRRELLGDDA